MGSFGLKKCLLLRFIDSRPLGLRCLMDMYLENYSVTIWP